MKLRRIVRPGAPTSPVLQQQAGGVWTDLTPQAIESAQLTWLARGEGWPNPQQPLNNDLGEQVCLPCQPLSFRDCMLFEAHWVQSSRGYARHFLPWTRPFTQTYEALTGKPFPSFRPGKLWYTQPVYYFSNHLTLVPGGGTVQTPNYTQALDYELELGWILSKPLYNATPDEALAAIGGFVVINDFSARDVQRAEMQTGLGPQKSKHFLSSMSPTLVTADSILSKVQQLQAHVEINGQCVSRTNTRSMRYHPGEVLAHLSRCEQLYPGELIASGTLPGGCGMEINRLLQPGDHLRLVIDEIGEIVHTIA